MTILSLWQINEVVPPPWCSLRAYCVFGIFRNWGLFYPFPELSSSVHSLRGGNHLFLAFLQNTPLDPRNDSFVSSNGVSSISRGLSMSATTLCVPLMYCKSGEYSSIYILHLMTLSEFKCLYVRFSFSVCTLIFCPSSMFLNSLSVSTIESSSRSAVV